MVLEPFSLHLPEWLVVFVSLVARKISVVAWCGDTVRILTAYSHLIPMRVRYNPYSLLYVGVAGLGETINLVENAETEVRHLKKKGDACSLHDGDHELLPLCCAKP